MAQLVMNAGRALVDGARDWAPELARLAADAAVDWLLAADHEGPRLSELAIQTSSDGAPMPRLWGRARIAGQVIWASRFSEQANESGGGKGGPSVTTYSYSVSFAVGLCEGEISGIGRVWANGALLDQSRYALRVHAGREDQAPDALIEAIEGAAAPAFRGTAYVVMEDWPLDEFGGRLPNLSFEVFRQPEADGLERRVRGVNLIPGTGEFAYAVEPVLRAAGPGEDVAENVNNGRGLPDFLAALEDLERDLPACRSVQLVVSWFGDDLRCGSCTIRPGVETADKATTPVSWSVAGLNRLTAPVVSQLDGRPVYGGTPDDASVVAAIQMLKARGYAVSLYPFILMDVPVGNGLPDPYGGAEQARFPWRGRISCHPAPGQAGSPDGTATAQSEVEAFFGTAQASDFTVSGAKVSYSGPAEWGLNRFILHCAALAKAAGGVEGFLIGSEMVSLTTVRGAGGTYPAVERLCTLAQEARALLGPACRISYAADWTEYSGHQDGAGGKVFHLDPLWSHPAISAVAIDWYVPLGDWREGEDHLDHALARSPHDRDYLASQIEGGEGYDWYYASEADRAAQLRTPISDGASEAWIWRYKDLRSWWSNAHHDRPGGVRQAEPTGWVPQGKPLWLTEVGCPAVDKGANRPNVFLDPKSAESDLPWHSTGVRDDLIQRRYVEAITGYWDAAENNPVSAVYGGPMVDPDLVHVWAFDARPWPDFPAREDVWSDGENWRRGHWLNGRAGQVPVAVIAQELAAGAGLEALDVSALDDLVPGYLVERPMPVRAALAPLLGVLGVSAWNRAEALVLASAGAPERVMELDDPVAGAAGEVRLSDADPAGLPGDVRLRFFDEAQDYRPGMAQARDTFGTSGSRDLSASLVADVALARTWCAGVLEDAAQGARTLGLTLPTELLALEPGDGVRFGDTVWCLQAVTGEMGGEAVLKRPTGRRASIQGTDGAVAAGLETPSRPLVQVLDLPAAVGGGESDPLVAAMARPWPGAVDVKVDGEPRVRLEQAARIGVLLDDLPAGPVGYWDMAPRVRVQLPRGGLSSVTDLAALNGVNRLAVAQGHGDWEVLGFAEAELEAPETWRVGRLLRGLHGTPVRPLAAGARVVMLDGALQPLPMEARELGETVTVTAVAAGLPAGSAFASTQEVTVAGRALWPLAPVHLTAARRAGGLMLGWIRSTRIGGDDWRAPEVPLGEAMEGYRVRLYVDESVVWEGETGAPSLEIGEADILALFGSWPDAVALGVAQLSEAVGAGREARRVIAL